MYWFTTWFDFLFITCIVYPSLVASKITTSIWLLNEDKQNFLPNKIIFQGEYEIKQIDTYGFILVSRGATPKLLSDIWK